MPDEQIQMLAEGFIFGTLTKAESEAFAQSLDMGEPSALAAFEEARRILLALPYTLPQQAPPPRLKQNILRALSAEENPKPTDALKQSSANIRMIPQRTFRQSIQRSLAWAAVFLLFAVGYGYWNQRQVISDLVRERAGLQQQLSAQQEANQRLASQLAVHARITSIIQKPKRLVIALNATKAEQTATGAAFVDLENARGSFVTDNLPSLAENQDYQLWYIGKSGPVDAGVFHVDAEGVGVVDIRNLPQDTSEITAFAVTIEPKGGSQKPTLEQLVLLGKIG